MFEVAVESDEILVEAVRGLAESAEPIIIRNGLCLRDLSQWHEFLRVSCGLREDRRHFGFDTELVHSDWWEISFQPEFATSYAYSNTRQPLHNDNAWFSDPGQINFFAMKKQAVSGGEQTVYPVYRIFEDLQRHAPGLLDDLCSVPVKIKKGDSEFEHNTTILVAGDRPSSNWNFYRTDKVDARVSKMCDEFFSFLEAREATASVQRVRCESGDCFAFNDQLILHGREAFDAAEPFDRVLYQSMWKL